MKTAKRPKPSLKTYLLTLNENTKYNPIKGRQVPVQVNGTVNHAIAALRGIKQYKGYEVVAAAVLEDDVYVSLFDLTKPPELEENVSDAEIDSFVDELIALKTAKEPIGEVVLTEPEFVGAGSDV